MPIHVHVRNLIHDPFSKLLAQRENPLVFGWHLCLRELAGLPQPDDTCYVQSPASHAPLVATAVHHRNEHHARVLAPDVQTSDTLRSVNFMSGEAGEIHIKIVNIERNISDCLCSIGME